MLCCSDPDAAPDPALDLPDNDPPKLITIKSSVSYEFAPDGSGQPLAQIQIQIQVQPQIQLHISSQMGPLNFIARISLCPHLNLHQTCLDSHCPRLKSRSRSRSRCRSRKRLTSLDKLFNTNRVTMFRAFRMIIHSKSVVYDPGRACNLYRRCLYSQGGGGYFGDRGGRDPQRTESPDFV